MDTSTEENEVYDGTGAMLFVLAVIVVYGVSVFFLVTTLLRKKTANQQLDSEIDR